MLRSIITSAITLAALIATISTILPLFRPQISLATLARRLIRPHVSAMSSATTTSAVSEVAPQDQLSRSVFKSVYAVEQSEGVGARVRRSIGSMALRNLSPFLM